MSNFPTELDTDTELPRVDDNITEIGAEAINALRDAMFNVEAEIGIGASGSMGSVAARIDVSLDDDGSIRPSALASLGLVTLPIRNSQIAADAGIEESKLDLYFGTSYLNDQISLLKEKDRVFDEFLSIIGIKVNPHVNGTDYRHELSHIDVDNAAGIPNLSTHILNKKNVSRNIVNAFNTLKDLNIDYVLHQKANGLATDATDSDTGTLPPDNFAHVAAGIYIDTSSFTAIEQTNKDLQSFAEAVDKSSLLLIGSRTQNLYSNGIPRSARSSVLDVGMDGYGQNVVPVTLVTTYLLNGNSTTPVDDINYGDDVIQFKPNISDNYFDAYFSQIKPGDIIRVDYGTILVNHIVESKKYSVTKDGYDEVISKSFFVRINGKNLVATTVGLARVDRPNFNENKYGVLAVAAANNSNLTPSQTSYPSLIVGNPRSAIALGINFDASKLSSENYKLYLEIYQNGDIDNAFVLPAIDVTGNAGITPGKYTLESVIEEFNEKVREAGYNYRFIAFSYAGNLGIMLADPYNNTSFSIISGIVDSATGLYDDTASESAYPENVFTITSGEINLDPLGFGPKGAGLASPAYVSSFSTPERALLPTKIFVPLKRNYYYVDGVETEIINKETQTSIDSFGDKYWTASITDRQVLSGRVETTYLINLDLSTSSLKVGKTIVVQPVNSTISNVDNGRFIISSVVFYNCDGYQSTTTIKVYDAIHATGSSPSSSSSSGTVRIYFSDDSVGFNTENVGDTTEILPFRRYFEIYVNQNGHTFTHERARISLVDTTDIRRLNIISVSEKIKGYAGASSNVLANDINLHINAYNSTTGAFSGFLSKDNGLTANLGPNISGKKGDIVRFYDETNVDYIDILFDLDDSVPTFSNKDVTIHLFPSLALDNEIMLIATCQLDDLTKKIKYIKDRRQFGNVSEKILSTSALDFISAGEKYLHENGIIRGFSLVSTSSNIVTFTGGLALVNGKLIARDNGFITLPFLQEYYASTVYANIQWAICINERAEFKALPLLDDTSSSLDVPTDESRIFIAKVPATLITYNLEALTFSDLISKRKDLTVLYIITTTVT